jgi:hypothetical protein
LIENNFNMKKQAIIIITPNLPGQTKLPGATLDAEAWRSFLLSPEGGAWEHNEIKVLSDQTTGVITGVLELERQKSLDYALIAFSGHGHYKVLPDKTTETQMFISANEYLTERSLTVRAKRELIVMDSCREYGGEIITEMKKSAQFSGSAMIRAEDRFAKAREMFEKALSLSPEGRTLVYSCSLNQTAGDKFSFTRFLISDAERLATECKLVQTISVKEAFDAAEAKPLKDNSPQKPVYDGGRRMTHYPFSVSL